VRLLLDTCTFLWIISDSPELSKRARKLFVDPANDVYLSTVSTLEIAVKYELGRLPLPEPPGRFIPHQRKLHGIESLPLDEETTLQLARLPKIHRDPFDRLLICQAMVHDLVIVTPDESISKHPVRCTW